MSKRGWMSLAAVWTLAGSLFAAESELLSGSINFSTPGLWGKKVHYGLDENGDTTGDTYWYVDSYDRSEVAEIKQRQREAAGYMAIGDTLYGVGLNRTIEPTRINGPRADAGLDAAEEAVYLDALVLMTESTGETCEVTNEADRIAVWISHPTDAAVNRLMITGGELQDDNTIVRKDFATSIADINVGQEHRLVIKSLVNDAGIMGFEVYFDGTLVTTLTDGTSFFPSLAGQTTIIHSLGCYGSAEFSHINFTHTNPVEHPDYDKADLSMFRQGTILTVDGFSSREEGLENFPLLVRISETIIKDFRYRYVNSSGTNMRFTDESGNVLPYEVDTWNTEGESLVWVRVPYLIKGARINMMWDQKQNTQAPKNVSTDVWTDYVAVWHMNEQDWAKDSSGNGFNASLEGTNATRRLAISQAGSDDLMALGNYGTLTDANLICADYDAKFGLSNNFTFTGWYRLDELTTTGMSLASKKLGTAVSASGVLGWCANIQNLKSSRYGFYGDSKTGGSTVEFGYDGREQWAMLGMSYENSNKITVYGNGEKYASSSAKISATTNRFQLAIAGTSLDELRISKLARSDLWIKTEYDQATNPLFLSNGGANGRTNYNFWVDEPYVSPSAWMPEEYDPSFYHEGRARYGVMFIEYYNTITGEKLTAQPSVEYGSYKAVYTADDGMGSPLVKECYFVIYESSGYTQLPIERVMLFNSDAAASASVELQGYYDVDDDKLQVWKHNSIDWTRSGEFKYVQRGDAHSYYKPNTGGTAGGDELWRFEHARIGNLAAGPGEVYDGMNLLPSGSTSRRILDSKMACDSIEFTGTLILQNISLNSIDEEAEETPAAVYSPHYTNGVGVVYFDAVNAFGGYRNVLKVQKRNDSEDEWTDVMSDVYYIHDGQYDASAQQLQVSEIVLNADEVEGASNRFYRIIANVDEASEVEFRIVRADTAEFGWADAEDPDSDGLILIDNILVAPTSVKLSLEQYGAPAIDQLGDNRAFRGNRAPFSVAFPSTNDIGNLYGAVKVNYSNGTKPDASYLGSLIMTYRWRYLNQQVDDWKELIMAADASDQQRFMTTLPLEASGVGDIEYSFRGIVNTPFYAYYDYTGLNLSAPADGVRQREVKLESDDYKYIPSPALGTNFFVRLREGASDYEGFRLEVRKIGESTVKQIDMDLFEDYTWRGFYQTLESVDDGIEYRIIAYNRQTEVMTDYQYTTNYYYSTSLNPKDTTKVPFSGGISEGEASTAWTTLPCDALTGYLLFQLNEKVHTLSVIHSDYQNFNLWTDAYSPATNAYFTGSSSSLPTSGVSQTAIQLSEVFNRFTETDPSNGVHWIEAFDVTASSTGQFALDKPFNSAVKTPNGWRAEFGRWVSEHHGQVYGDSISLQLRGEGLGKVYPNSLEARGIDEFKFTARIAQTYDIHSFNYYRGTNEYYTLDGYAFGVMGAMAPGGDDFGGAGALSVVGHFSDDKGGYEARVERFSDTAVTLSLYKWPATGNPTLLGTSDLTYNYVNTGCSGSGNNFAGLFISCKNNSDGSVLINAGLSKAKIDTTQTGQKLFGNSRAYYSISYLDTNDVFSCGTFGVGCNNCPATFVHPKVIYKEYGQLATKKTLKEGVFWRGECTLKDSGEEDLFPDSRSDTYHSEYYNQWSVYSSRLGAKDYTNDPPKKVYGFKANIPEQYIQVETSPRGLGLFTSFTNIVINSFSLEPYVAVIHDADDIDIQLRASDEVGGYDIVVDDLELTQWRGENYDDEGNPDRLLYDTTGPNRLAFGAPTNFVYTTGWINEDSLVELNPLRTSTNDSPAGIRGPLFDGEDGRGMGLGQFSFRYYNADIHTRLVLQIARNVNVQDLADLTLSADNKNWVTVHTFDFSECTDVELESGVCTWYVGEHGVNGVMRVILDPTLLVEARSQEPQYNPTLDTTYGRIFIVSASAKDNPALENGNWWGWNLRTAMNSEREGPFGDGDGEMQLLKDGYDGGLAYGLNNSTVRDIKPGDDVVAHMPFLQTPVFERASIGEVTFKARKYSSDSGNPTLVLYGFTSNNPTPSDSELVFITNITVSCNQFQTFRVQAPIGSTYTGFRFGITGVDGVVGERGPRYAGGPQRILLDEVTVYEAILARLGFCNTGCFRSGLADNKAKSPFPTSSEQPICSEQWGFQTEIYAASLSNEIDTDTPGREPRVFVSWYEGDDLWGYTNWVNSSKAILRRELHRADSSSLVYRSSHEFAPEAVVQPSESQTVVQYSMQVIFYMRGQENPLTNTLSVTDWEKPDWYEPIDLNEEHSGYGFSAYNIIDTVSPGWAWINEINIFGKYDEEEYNTDQNHQYVEIAAPAHADISDWELRFLVPESGTDGVRTNIVATFGQDGLEGTKLNNMHAASGMVFRVITSPNTWDQGKLRIKDGTADGYWSVPDPDGTVLKWNGEISEDRPVGIQLVRPSGIVEHEIVAMGTNYWGASSSYPEQYDPSNTVNYLNSHIKGAHFFYLGKDEIVGEEYSLDVYTNRGETASTWVNTMVQTPGKINRFKSGETQWLDPAGPPTPLGSTLFIWSYVINPEGVPHLFQTCGDVKDSTEMQVILMNINSMVGTNIQYRTSNWYEIDQVTANGVPVTVKTNGLHNFSVEVGAKCSENITLSATYRISSEIDKLIPDEDSAYRPAIMDWFNRNQNAYGTEWPESTDGKIHLAKFWPYYYFKRNEKSSLSDLTLTEMYWLDMCPTLTNEQYLVAGFTGCPTEVQRAEGDVVHTNRQVTVFMVITNGLGSVSGSVTNTVFSPYVIQALDPGTNSWDYARDSSGWYNGWSNATFKISGLLRNGLTDVKDPDQWVPLRLFVFGPDSFYAPDCEASHQPYTTEVEVIDPYSPDSVGYREWGLWMEKNHRGRGTVDIWHKWSLDERMQPISVEILKPNSYYE